MFRKDQGAYDPVISNGRHLYLTGNHTLTALRPLQRHGAAAKERARKAAKRIAKRKAARKAARKRADPWRAAHRKAARKRRAARR